MRKTILYGFALLAALAAGLAIVLIETRPAPAHLSLEARSGEALAQEEDTLVVDIRRPEEWVQTGVVAGAVLVTYTDAKSFIARIEPLLAPGQELALICRSGNRSSLAAREIAQRIDNPVVDIAGGMLRVVAEGYSPLPPRREQGCMIC
ncbi:MAG: Rhodanese-related sulfurtransferase [Saliniramus fredricksonii]|uniref:Rhodanese-related sulfurtransferase n=1 Tax=Saliniramus fredricksonii TaxID=1653334 RepID=A0A0P7XRY9_9HYPH|nr:rhodanese-like domain-containing protein [Saliniramus fredricksonii]KPQ10345.1 MAG: Rhodanese-related sulfurtransferase [Saliniramus fredricksonii]SCC79680.1 Rhodanese-related sulfurtransferase [Saliniramus fredricksonii]